MTTSPALAQLQGVTKRFAAVGPPALEGISGSIEAGGITGVVGPDGAGKTTLLRLMTGLMLPDAGSVEVLGLARHSWVNSSMMLSIRSLRPPWVRSSTKS